MRHRLARIADLHWWIPFLRGTDGATGRERRRMAAEYAGTVGAPMSAGLRARIMAVEPVRRFETGTEAAAWLLSDRDES